MTLTRNLPDDRASRLAACLPETERDEFAVAAIAKALAARQTQDEARLADLLLTDLDPDKEPEREAAECRAAVEEGLETVSAGYDLVTFEEAQLRWTTKRNKQAAADPK